MKAQKIYILAIIFSGLLLNCKKEEFIISPLQPQNIKLYQDKDVKWVFDAVAGDGVALLSYVDNYDQYQFKLIDNLGQELWTKSFGYKHAVVHRTEALPGREDTAIHVLYDIDNSFSIIRGNRLKKINHQGEIIFNDNSFFTGLETTLISKVILGRNDNYLILGSRTIIQPRAVAVEFNRQGQQNFLSFSSSIGTVNNYTDGKLLDNNEYLIAGVNLSTTNSITLAKLSQNGDLSILKNHDLENFEGEGRGLFKTENDEIIYLVSAKNPNTEDGRSRVYRFDKLGEIIELSYVDFGPFNYCTSNALIKKSDGSFFGLAKMANEYIPEPTNNDLVFQIFVKVASFTPPNHSFNFKLNSKGQVQNQQFFQTTYSNYFNAAKELSNGDIIIYGAIQSFGEEVKLSVIINQ